MTYQPAPDLMTPQEVARLFRVYPKTVSRWAATGRIPCTKTPGGRYRFEREAVMAFYKTEVVQ